jgi:tetratricopeptide (TPR) repeat protein
LADKLGVPLREIMGMQELQLEAGFQIDMLKVYLEKADYLHALDLIANVEQHKELLEHQRVELLICRAQCLIKTKEFDQAIILLSSFLEHEQIQQTIDDGALCDVYNKLGNAFYGMRDYEKAYSAYEQGYRISLRLPEFGLVSARVTHNLGITCNRLNYKEDAHRYLQMSYRFYESISEVKGVADALFELAIATGDSDHMTKALSLYEALNMIREANNVKQHYAFHIDSKRELPTALLKFDESIESLSKLNDLEMCVYVSARATIACLQNDEISLAEKYIVRAEYFRADSVGTNDILTAEFFRARAMFHLKQENYEQCIFDSQTASELCDKMGLSAESAASLEVSAEAYHQKGDADSAYLVFKKIIELLRPRRGH